MAVLIALVVAAVAAYALTEHYPSGHGPLDLVPAGAGKPVGKSTKVVAPSSGIAYETYTFAPEGDQQFHVAKRADGKLGWVSYYMTRSTGARKYYAGWTPEQGDQVALLKLDFGV
jgi:hypothetical protein